MRLSLVDNDGEANDPRLNQDSPNFDPEFNPPAKICKECELLHFGCRICEDSNPLSCAMCEFPYYNLFDEGEGKMGCVDRCPNGYFPMEVEADEKIAPSLMKDRRHSVCTSCTGDCEECIGSADKCLKCKDPTKVALRNGTCSDNCESGSFNKNGRCRKCGKNIAECSVDSTTHEFKVDACETGFFLNPMGTACVKESGCGKGYFGDLQTNKCAECDGTKCTQCKGTADHCTECKDRNLFVSKDGSCTDDPSGVSCDVGTYKSKSGVCKP
jgi:hypothetical protein